MRGIALSYVPPISVVLAADRERYIEGLTHFREGDIESWIERFSVASAHAARLAEAYLGAVAVQKRSTRPSSNSKAVTC
jgi:hypothetical protein